MGSTSSGSTNSTNAGISSSSYGSQGSSGSTPQQILANYSKYLPSFLQQNAGQIAQFTNALNSSSLNSVQGTGGQVAQSVAGLTNQTNPAVQGALGTAAADAGAANTAVKGASNELGAINLNGLSPGEANATERSLNQSNVGTGNLGLLNPTNTIANAMDFGGAYNSKLPLYNTAVNTATSAAGAMQGANTAFGNAANTATNAQAGTNAIANPTSAALGATLSNSGLLGNLSTGNFAQNSGGGTSNSANFGLGSGSNSSFGIANGCCFIFMEAYHGSMPLSVRRYRDRYYRRKPTIANGYKRMAKWLVPLMQRYAIVRGIVWHCMINPATKHTEHSMCNLNKVISHFWLRVWAVYGKV